MKEIKDSTYPRTAPHKRMLLQELHCQEKRIQDLIDQPLIKEKKKLRLIRSLIQF